LELRGGGKGKENDRTSTISKYITSGQVEDLTVLKADDEWGLGGKG
jgi:hypothetical protein